MKQRLIFLAVCLICGAAIGQADEYFFSYTQKRETDYLKAIDVKVDSQTGAVTTTLVPGTVTTGARIVRAADSSCREEISKLLRLERVETPNGAIQRPIVEATSSPVTCPVAR